jgi:hypothetical protein
MTTLQKINKLNEACKGIVCGFNGKELRIIKILPNQK